MISSEIDFLNNNNNNYDNTTVKNYLKSPLKENINGFRHCVYQTQSIISENPKENDKIGDFYRGTSVFVTGITGFVGKTLLEKLLRSCDGIKKIYVLVRPKKGLGSEDRLQKILQSPAFDKIKQQNPKVLSKIIVVDGDCSIENLGLANDDRQKLINDVNIVFHSAASVRFSEPLRDAINLNTCGTKIMLELCKEMKQIKSFVYVSTAFSNSDRVGQIIEEKVYEPKYDAEGIINFVKTLPPDLIQGIEAKIIGGHPNTYTFSKALAEHIVQKYSKTVPVTIVRPSIVTASMEEPAPGWTDSMTGATGVISEAGRGGLKSAICMESNRMDLIPADILTNTLIAAAWHNYHHKSDNLMVYNCTTGTWNPLTWKSFSNYVERFAKEYPSGYLMWYPKLRLTINKPLYWFLQVFLQYILVVTLDWQSNFTSKNKTKQFTLTTYYKRFMVLLDHLVFFTINEFDFAQDNMKTLARQVSKAKDGNDFDVDISKINFEKYMENYTLGIRKYLLKEDLSSLPKAKVTLKRIYWIRILMKIFIGYILFAILFWILGVKMWPVS